LKLKFVQNWSFQILQAMVYLHEQSPPIIHGDIRSQNIFIVTSINVVKLGDFGLAVLLDNSTDYIPGRINYMASEIFEKQYDQLIDIYAFGMCLLEMIT